MSHLISSCQMLTLASDCEGSAMELSDTGLTWTPWFFKVFFMILAFRCSPESVNLWREED